MPTIFDLVRLINYLHGDDSGLPAVPPGITAQERSELADVNQDGVVDLRDVDALGDAILGISFLPAFSATAIIETSPANGEELVSPARTVILRFSRRVAPATINSNNFYLIATGERLPGRIEISSTERFATFFPAGPFPASTEIRISVNPTNILDRYGRPLARSAGSLPAADGPSARPRAGRRHPKLLPDAARQG